MTRDELGTGIATFLSFMKSQPGYLNIKLVGFRSGDASPYYFTSEELDKFLVKFLDEYPATRKSYMEEVR